MSEDNNDNKPIDLNGRDPESKPFEKESPLEQQAQMTMGDKVSYKLTLISKIKEISKGDWLLTQEIAQELEAVHISNNPGGNKITANKLIDSLRAEIEERYKDDQELKTMLLDSIPAVQRIRVWRNQEGWEEAVWGKIRTTKMFNNDNRFKVINSLFEKATKDGDVAAAKIWLTLSGDYADKMDLNTDKRVEAYREINSILHNKKKSTE